MLKKYWKKIGLVILIIACVFNIVGKLVRKISFNKELVQSAQYMFDSKKEENVSAQNQKQENNINQNQKKESNQKQKSNSLNKAE